MSKNNNKIYYIILGILFIILFSFYNFSEYKNFHLNKIELENTKIEFNKKLKSFTLDDIKIIDDINFYYTPDKNLITKIINHIENAEKEIFLEVYMLTETRIQEALIKAHKKGIIVKIILEKDPYLAYNINNKAFEKLEKAGIDIIWSNKQNYSYNHSKVLIIDNLSIISTGNYSYSTFTKNRDFFIFTTEKNINNKLRENFINDYNGIKINIFDENLIFSPNSSRIKFEKLFDTANKDIKMYFQYFEDDELVNRLINIKEEKNIEINVIIPDTAKEDPNVKKMFDIGIKINILSKHKMHAKSILIDNKYLFIGSINFSTYSIDKNREVGILILNTEVINNFLEIFNQDVKTSFSNTK
ncbi:MAG: phosphatidylserine/phosphatidylglycerophosphate/cardiolipin synthase family protein [Candidatus Gracilibacteria bacterium]